MEYTHTHFGWKYMTTSLLQLKIRYAACEMSRHQNNQIPSLLRAWTSMIKDIERRARTLRSYHGTWPFLNGAIETRTFQQNGSQASGPRKICSIHDLPQKFHFQIGWHNQINQSTSYAKWKKKKRSHVSHIRSRNKFLPFEVIICKVNRLFVNFRFDRTCTVILIYQLFAIADSISEIKQRNVSVVVNIFLIFWSNKTTSLFANRVHFHKIWSFQFVQFSRAANNTYGYQVNGSENICLREI